MASVAGEVPMLGSETAARIAMEAASAAAARGRGERPRGGGAWRLSVARAMVATEFLAALANAWANGPADIADNEVDDELGGTFAAEAEEIAAAAARLAENLVGDRGGIAVGEAIAAGTRAAMTGASPDRVGSVALEALFEAL